MVKVTVECDGKKMVFSGDMVITHVITRNESETECKNMALGIGSVKMIAGCYAKAIPNILADISDDPVATAASLIDLNSEIDGEIKKYMSENADSISKAMANTLREMFGGGR